MAVSSALTGSLGFLRLIKGLKATPATKNMLNKIAPFVGVVSSNLVNLFFSRYQDFQKGIKVYDPLTNERIDEQGSLIAAKIAFQQTAVSRILIPASMFALPYMYSYGLTRANINIKNRFLGLELSSAVGAISLYLGLTYALAIFPQYFKVPASNLEPYFHNLKNKKGEQIKVFAFNKGL